jgi:hypothetical protein
VGQFEKDFPKGGWHASLRHERRCDQANAKVPEIAKIRSDPETEDYASTKTEARLLAGRALGL